METGTKIKKLRELRNYTQEYMAAELNMTTAGYGKIERNESELTLQKLEKIAEILEMKVEDVFNFNEKLIFNVMHNQVGNGYVVQNGVSEQQKELYEQIITQLKEENIHLKTLLDKVLSK